MSDNRDVAAKLLGEAATTILRKRPGVHGSAENSFAMIGEMWTVFLRHHKAVRKHDNIMPEDVAQMMSILKKCRAIYGDKANEDNFVDDIGYAALAGMLQLPDPSVNKKTEQEKAEEKIANDISAALDKRPSDEEILDTLKRKEETQQELTEKVKRKVPKMDSDGFAGNDGRSAPGYRGGPVDN